jgi:uncharacterized integral membrane protein
MIRKVATALVLIPFAVVFISFAVANRQTVVVSFDPFDQTNPAVSFSMPLFVLILLLMIVGVIVGGFAAWLRQGKWRWRARIAEAQTRELLTENDNLKRRAGAPPAGLPVPAEGGSRLSIPPPAA